MPYLIVTIIGLVLIYFALKNDRKPKSSKTSFSDILKRENSSDQLDFVNETLSELSLRVEDIESALVLLNEKIDSVNKETVKTQNHDLYFESKASTSAVPSAQPFNQSVLEGYAGEEVGTMVEPEPEPVILPVEVKKPEPDVETVKTRKRKVAPKKTDKDINDVIYSMYDEGNSLEDICSTLNIGKGEVLLRLGLRK